MHHSMKTLALFLSALVILLPLGAQQLQNQPTAKITFKVAADYLALHSSGSAPASATALEYRLTMSNDAAKAGAWTAFPQPPAADGSFQFDVQLPEWRWSKLEVRALAGGQVLASAEAKPKQPVFEMLTPQRIGALPDAERAAWQSYMETTRRHAEHEREVLAAECRQLGFPLSKAAPNDSKVFKMDKSVLPTWYGSAEALKLADAVLSYQTPAGGWSKAIGYAAGPRTPGKQWTCNAGNPWHYCGTLDNSSTTEQIKFLANIYLASKREDAKAGALRGIEWLLAAQFPNGGWPQVYPAEPGYHEAITLNDNAMLHALEVLLAMSKGDAPFTFLDAAIRQRGAAAFEKGIACLVACQVRVAGKPTVWCAQHDPLSLAPVAARLKEPPSLSGAESAEMLKFMMREVPLTPAVISTIRTGIAWLTEHRIQGLRKIRTAAGKTDYVPDASSTEIYWARFYDVQTGQPIFAGAQDGKIYASFHEMAQHNKVAYDYFTTKPADLAGKEFERWEKRMQKEGKDR